MIQDVGNIELCELIETEPKTQCTAWSFLAEKRRSIEKIAQYTLDLHSVPEYVIKKERAHGHRNGKKPGDK